MKLKGGCLSVCSRGLYSCYWTKPSNSKRKMPCCWLSFVAVVSLLSLCWLYVCLVSFNDREELNGRIFMMMKRWINWFMVIIIISAVLVCYSALLLLFAFVQIALGEKLDLHWLHKVFLFLGVALIFAGVTAFIVMWERELPSIPLSLQATGPFLQFGAVGAQTLLSPFVFRAFHKAKKCSKILIFAVSLAVSAAILLCPLLIDSPCFIELKDLPEKPKMIGHRGAPMIAPENTMMSFERSISCGVTAFETDVQLSEDNIPFLMHDNKSEFLLRTTDIRQKSTGPTPTSNRMLSFDKLQELNAGKWFLESDPFWTVSQMSEEEKETARNQTIPLLEQLLELAKQHNISVLFDLYSSGLTDTNQHRLEDTKAIVKTILNSTIDPKLILWLPPEERAYVKKEAPGFIHVYNKEDSTDNESRSYLNLKYNSLSMNKIRELRKNNITVNLWVVNERWLFSLLWCAGASSVTTNSCHLLKDVSQPDWFMSRRTYTVIWILVDLASILMMVLLFICQRRRFCSCSEREDLRMFRLPGHRTEMVYMLQRH